MHYVGRMYNILMLNIMVHKVTTTIWKFKLRNKLSCTLHFNGAF